MELSPSISKSKNMACTETRSCPAPMYFLNDKYLGEYSNIPEIRNVTTGEENHGLEEFDELFFRPSTAWAKAGTYTIKMRFDDEDFESDLFYYCRVHEFMVGRIKLTRNGVPISELDNPSLGFIPDEASDFDLQCGTHGLDKFQLPNRLCPDRFVCGVDEQHSENIQLYAKCNDAMNCKMLRFVINSV